MASTGAPPRPPARGATVVVVPTAGTPQQNLFHVVGYPCVLVFLFFYYSRLLDLGLGYLHLPLLFAAVAAFAAFASGNIWTVLRSKITICLLLYTCWMCCSIPFSAWKGGSFAVLSDVWIKSVTVFFAAGCLVTSVGRLAKVMRWIAAGILAACCIALAANVTGWDGRLAFPKGELANANQLAFAATNGMVMLWVIVGNRRHGPLFRLAAALALAIPIVTLIRTGSRAGLISFVLLVVAGTLGARGKQRIVMVLAGISIASLLLVPGVNKRFLTLFNRSDSSNELVSAAESAQNRLELLRDGVVLTARHPLFGVGAGNYPVVRADMLSRTSGTEDWHVTHNTFVQISSECGIPALLFYLAMIVFCFRAVGKLHKRTGEVRPELVDEYMHVGFCIRLCLVTTVGFLFFSSSAYDFYLPTLAGLIVGFEYMTRPEERAAQAPPPVSPVATPAAPPPEPPAVVRPRRNRPGLMP